jgi:hypothetical protein
MNIAGNMPPMTFVTQDMDQQLQGVLGDSGDWLREGSCPDPGLQGLQHRQDSQVYRSGGLGIALKHIS